MYKTYINTSPTQGFVEIYFVEVAPGSDGMIMAIAEPMELKFRKLDRERKMEVMQPSLRIRGFESAGFLKSIAEALDERGMKTESDAKIAGTLEATRHHLADLRQMLKLT